MYILVFNGGSSSLKVTLYDYLNLKSHYKAHVDGISLDSCKFKQHILRGEDYEVVNKKVICKNHDQAFKMVLKGLIDSKILKKFSEIKVIGHRVVHGGEKLIEPTFVNPLVKREIKKNFILAPLHNPANYKIITASQKYLKSIPDVAVFDTAFYQTLPRKAYLYALPMKLYRNYHIRKYGFHGISHEYVSSQTLKLLKKNKSKIITCHLGNGVSISAIKDGKCVDTSMGFTPMTGAMMGTRIGDFDPSIIRLLLKKGYTFDNFEKIFNYDSGLKGVSGITSDVRILRDKWFKEKDVRAKLALDLYCYDIAKYIGSYILVLGGFDAITFTAGVGQNAWYVRKWICDYLKFSGLSLDDRKNKKNDLEIHDKKSKIKVFVITTKEGLQIAKVVKNLISQSPL